MRKRQRQPVLLMMESTKFDPMITGYEGNDNYKQTLPIKYNMLVNFQFNTQHATYIQAFHSYGATLFHLGYQLQDLDSLYGLKLYPLEGAVGLEFKNEYVDIGFVSKPFDYQDSEVLEFKFSVAIPLY